jgi:Zn-finger nucleic acid-binding protein
MNRVNFGKVSGVIVDVCRAHGTWFDGGELTRVVSFAAFGGLTKARRREEEEKKEAAAAARHPAHPVHGPYGSRSYEANERLEEWRTFLRELLWW